MTGTAWYDRRNQLLPGIIAPAAVTPIVDPFQSRSDVIALITQYVIGTTGLSFTNALTLGGNLPAYFLARGNHTGTQLSTTISDFDTQVRTSRLDQLTSPTTEVGFNAQRITNLATPITDTDGTNKGYVDARVSALSTGLVLTSVTPSNPANMLYNNGGRVYWNGAEIDTTVTYSNLVAALGYSPVNKAGDTMTGVLTVPKLTVQGGIKEQVNVYTSGVSLTDYNYIVLMNITVPVTVALPAGVNHSTFRLRNVGSATATIQPNGADTIELSSGYSLAPSNAVDVSFYGTNWYVF